MKKIIILILLVFTVNLSAQEVLDKIVAVVGNEVILKSELDYRASYAAVQSNIDPNNEEFRRQILNSMIDEKLLYAQAQRDTLEVSDDQVDQAVDNQIQYLSQQYGNQARLEQTYGMSVEKIKRTLREDTRKNLMAQMVQQQKFGNVDVTRREVEQFYETYKDSLEEIPEKFKIAHIFINPVAGERVKQKAKDFAKSLFDSLKNGANFAELARKYSDDPGSASEGGDLGFVKRGVLVPEFEAAAFALKPGEISDVVKTPFGYHIIQLLERRGETIHARHILIKVKGDNESDLKAIEFLSEIRDSIESGVNTFDYYARKYSDDKESARLGGVLGTFEKGQLDKPMLDQIYKLKEGEISFPKRLDIDKSTYGFHIVKLIDRIPAHKVNMDYDYEQLKQLTVYNKKQRLYSEYVDKLKKQIYWDIRL